MQCRARGGAAHKTAAAGVPSPPPALPFAQARLQTAPGGKAKRPFVTSDQIGRLRQSGQSKAQLAQTMQLPAQQSKQIAAAAGQQWPVDLDFDEQAFGLGGGLRGIPAAHPPTFSALTQTMRIGARSSAGASPDNHCYHWHQFASHICSLSTDRRGHWGCHRYRVAPAAAAGQPPP